MLNERYLSISSIVIIIFVITLGFNNCGEGFQTIGDGTNELFSIVDPTEPQPIPKPPLVQKVQHISFSQQPISLDVDEKNNKHIQKFNNNLYTLVKTNADTAKPSLLYGTFDQLFTNNYQIARIPAFEELPQNYILQKYVFTFLRDMVMLHAVFINNDNNQFRTVVYKYTENLGQLEYSHYFTGEDSPNSSIYITEKNPLSQNWDLYESNETNERYISKNGVDSTKIPVHDRGVKVSNNEKWLISLREDGHCYATDLETRQFTFIGEASNSTLSKCYIYSFLTNDVIVKNYSGSTFVDYLSDTPKEDIQIIDFKNSQKFTVPDYFFTYDEESEAITYVGDDDKIKKQYLSDFLKSEIPTVSYNIERFEKFGKINYAAYFFNDQFQYVFTTSSNQNYFIINNSTGKTTALEKAIPSSVKATGMNPGQKLFSSILKFNDQHYLTLNFKDYYKVNFSDTPQNNQIDLPEYSCELSTEPKAKLSDTCLWDLVNANKQYKNFFKYNVRFELTTETLDSKNRWAYIPPGTSIDNTDDDNWVYPKGTILFKNFAYKEYINNILEYTNIETRVLEKVSDEVGTAAWRPSVYLWNADQTEAVYTEDGADIPMNHKNQEYTYKVPKTSSCTQCHGGGIDMVAGFNHLQLDSGFAKLGPLHGYHNDSLLSKAPTEYEDIPSKTNENGNIISNVIGNLSVNCAGCHSPKGFASFLGLDFTYKLGTATHEQTNAYITTLEKDKMKLGDHANSRIYTAVESGYMPKGAATNNSSLALQIRYWIDSFSE